jgi:radical S-adenosyl methionine domain-containing protein 2
MIPSVNFHLWEPCNMKCKFCFATFQDVKQSILPKGHLPKDQALEVVYQLAEIGFEKITFAGGEPTLCPWLPDLIKAANESGMTTMLVSNGSKLNTRFLEMNQEHLDWITISIDSLNTRTNISTGRAVSGRTPIQLKKYLSIIAQVQSYGYGFKINTVVNQQNYKEDMSAFIQEVKPKRWKVFQALPVKGQNDNQIDQFTISPAQFSHFIDNHKKVEDSTILVPETNDQMTGTYAMVDPAGRFFDNTKGKHTYSNPILEIGARLALQEVHQDFGKFVRRQGIYDWTTI